MFIFFTVKISYTVPSCGMPWFKSARAGIGLSVPPFSSLAVVQPGHLTLVLLVAAENGDPAVPHTPGLLWVVLQNPLFSLHNQSLKEILVFKKLCQAVTSATASERGSFFSSFPFPLFNFYFVWTGVMPMYISV